MESPLGRGLDSLIARTFEAETSSATEIPLDEISPNPRQPRKTMDEGSLEGLATSIREHGVLQPIVVRRTESGYELIAGERRFRASRRAGRTSVPAVIVDAKGIRSLELALIENIQRENLNALEEAAAYEQLIVNTGLTHEELAARVGKSRSAITNALRLLELPDDLRQLLSGGALSAGQARAVLSAGSVDEAREIAHAAAEQKWSVRQVEQEVRTRKQGRPRSQQKKSASGLRNRTHYEDRLRTLYGTRVSIVESTSGGEVRFRFYSDDDRDRLLHLLLSVDG